MHPRHALVAAALLISAATAFAPAPRRALALNALTDRTGVLLEAKKKKKDLQTPKPVRERKVKEDKIEVDGVVVEALPSANFRVEIGVTKQVMLCAGRRGL